MTILWLRHGETALNAARVVQPADTPLSPRGLAQAASAARRLADAGAAALLSSDLPRAHQTAEAVAAATGLPLLTEPLLRERNFGDWRGRTHDSLGVDLVRWAGTPPNGESMAEFLARIALAWQTVVARRAALGGPLIVVSHGFVIRAALEQHTHRQHAGAPALPARLANASLSIVEAAMPHRLLLADCTRHLGPDCGPDPLAGAV